MDPPPPPPPPHGQNPKSSSGLPPGNYDIFIIPPHSSGGGFVYLPSMRPNVNSFVAGFASCMILVVIFSALKPVALAWWSQAKGSGGATTIMLVCGIALGAWVLGRAQSGGPAEPGTGAGGAGPSSGGYQGGAYPGGHSSTHSGGHSHAHSNGYENSRAGGAPPPPPPQSGPQPGSNSGPPPTSRPMPGEQAEPPPNPQWERPPPPPTPEPKPESKPQPQTNASAKAAWEKAREETRRREEERKAKEAEQKRREELDKKIKAMREKEAREREAREKKKQEDEEKVKAQKKMEDRAKELADARARLAERKAAEAAKKAAGEKEAAAKKAAEELAAKKAAEQVASKPPSSAYAFSSVGERMSPWPNGRPPSPPKPKPQPTPPASPKKPPPPPTAKTYLGPDDDSFSYRPYDKQKRPPHVKSPSSIYSESSYASQTTSKTTPPPSHRGPYRTNDPDKIVIKAVYAFTNAYVKTPTSQLISGLGSVTDGLILRITTEGLFIDDDVRGVPQREWDIKAWTMKLVEVWCPSFRQGSTGTASARVASSSSPSASQSKNFRRLWGLDKEKAATSEETDALLVDMLQLCKNNCRLHAINAGRPSDVRSYATSSVYSASSAASSDRDSVFSADDVRTNKRGAGQTGENKNAKLHVLRASIRDQEGKKYLFVISEEESWKVAVGLQRLRRGTQVRALGVSGMTVNDARSTLENLGWG